MAKGKIAPMLQHFISARTCHQGECGGDAECDRVEKELAALLAVVRAASRVARDWDRWDEATPETCRAFHKALARLDRVSSKGDDK